MLNFSVFDSILRKISYEKPKLSFFAEIWCQEILYPEFNGGVHLLYCGWDIPFLGKLGPKNYNFKLKFATKTNSNMQN